MNKPGFLDAFLEKRPQNPDATDPDATDPDAPAADAQAAGSPAEAGDRDQELEMRVIDMLRTIYDPEIPVDIYELGLIYQVNADAKGDIKVVMTLTTPHCPVAESLPGEVETKIRGVDGVNDVDVEVTWDPPWDQTMMSEAARLELGFL